MSIPLTLGADVSWQGRPIPGERVHLLLAVLVAHAPRMVDDRLLIEEIWGDELPVNPTKALQVLISRARTLTTAHLVDRVATGYRLTLPFDEVDLFQLTHWASAAADLLHAGNARGAAALAEQARAVAVTKPAADQIDALATLRTQALRDRAAATRILGIAQSTLGEHAAALPLLRAALADQPDDEDAFATLLTSEAAALGAAAALNEYERYRAGLAERLGTDPGPRLARLHQQLLEADRPTRQGIRHSGAELLGRDEDLKALSALVRSARVTSIVGAGGLGKTRLAHIIGATAEQSVVHFIELVGVTAGDDVITEVGSALEVRDSVVGRRALSPTQRSGLRSQIAQQLDRTPTLLILDNCEHVISAAAELVAFLVASCRDLHVLTTSRAPLGIAAEHVYALDQLSHEDAESLFRLRARAARPGVTLHPAAVRAVVDRLDGLPLAIELAAAKVRALSVDDIATRLADRFALLQGRDPSAPDRHQTLLAVIDWSWNLLAPREQRALRWLSVFHDGFTLTAAEAMLGPDALISLELLADQSLIVVRDLEGGVRYRMLETVRDFGRRQLAYAEDEAQALATQTHWALGLAADAGRRLFGEHQVAALTELRAEETNLTDILHRRLAAGDPGSVVRLIAALGTCWAIRGESPRLMAMAKAVETIITGWRPAAPDADDARTAMVLLGLVASVVGVEMPHALALLADLGPGDQSPFTRAAARLLLEAPPDGPEPEAGLWALAADPEPATASLALQWISYRQENSGDPLTALDTTTRALDLIRGQAGIDALGPWWEAMLEGQLAQLYAHLGQFQRGAEHARRAVPVLAELASIDDLMQTRGVEAMAALVAGRVEEAQAILDTFDDYEGAWALSGNIAAGPIRAELALARGDIPEALACFDQLADELEQHRFTEITASDGMEPWPVVGHALALVAHSRYGTALSADPHVAPLLRKARLWLHPPTDDRRPGPVPLRGDLDLPVTGLMLFALGAWGLLHSQLPAADAARLLTHAHALEYPRSVPVVAWEPMLAVAQERAPGEVERLAAAYANRRGPELIDLAREAFDALSWD